MGVTVIQYETRDDPSLNALMAMNKAHCVKKGYIYNRFGPLMDMPPYWIKVNLVLMVLRGAADGDIVCWLDSDAVIVDEQTPVQELFREAGHGKFFLASKDPKPWTAAFNAGVFFVKANGVSRRLVEDWMDLYNPRRWTQLGSGEWKCSGAWAGEDYEQGAFIKHMLPKYKEHIRIFDADKFDCTTPAFAAARPNGGRVFCCHFAGAYKKRIPDLLADHARGTGKERPVGLSGGETSPMNIALLLVGVLIGLFVIFAFTKKGESASPAAAALGTVWRWIKSLRLD